MDLFYEGKPLFQCQETEESKKSSANDKPFDVFCSLGHKLQSHTSYLGGCCDVRYNMGTMCSTQFSKGEKADVWCCFKCNYWMCEDCYETKKDEDKKAGSMKQLECAEPQFAPIMVAATIISFSAWLKAMGKNINEDEWEFNEDMPAALALYIKEYAKYKPLVEKLNNNKMLKITVDTSIENIEKQLNTYKGYNGSDDFTIDHDTIAKNSDSSTLYSLAHLNIEYNDWHHQLEMIKMYERGYTLLTLPTSSPYVFMGTDKFNNIWVRYIIPGKEKFNVSITYLKNKYNYYELTEHYKSIKNLTADRDSKFKGVRFLPTESKVKNVSMHTVLGARLNDFISVGNQVSGTLSITGNNMLSLTITSVTMGNLRSAGGPKRECIDGFVDFFHQNNIGRNNMDFNYLINVYAGSKLLYNTIHNKKNYMN